jgi:hypothetical protein
MLAVGTIGSSERMQNLHSCFLNDIILNSIFIIFIINQNYKTNIIKIKVSISNIRNSIILYVCSFFRNCDEKIGRPRSYWLEPMVGTH